MLARLFRRQTPCFRRYAARSRIFSPSPEQLAIIESCKSHNVMVSARPGSGKTATAEALVRTYADSHIILVTYSKNLQMETNERLKSYPNVDVFTFHGLASRIMGEVVFNDSILQDLRERAVVPEISRLPPYEYVVLDELQDLTPNLYWLTCSFLSALMRRGGHAPRILALGDRKQRIFNYRGADARFLDLSSKTFETVSPYPWQLLDLSKSFRLTAETANFVNNVFLGGDAYILGSKKGPKPLYLHVDLEQHERLIEELLPLIRKYGPENTAILAPSVRTFAGWYLRGIANNLCKIHHIPVSVSIYEDTQQDAAVMAGKLVVATYHQFKGMERDLIITFGVDNGYFNRLAPDLPDDRCPNALYVALTRAREQLVVLQSHKQSARPFVDLSSVHEYADFRKLHADEPQEQQEPGRSPKRGLKLPPAEEGIAVTDLCRYVRDEEMGKLIKEHLIITKHPAHSKTSLKVADKVCTDRGKNFYEAVSDINGRCVTAAFEWRLQGTLTSVGFRKDQSQEVAHHMGETEAARATFLAREATKHEAKQSRYYTRLLQMPERCFKWLVEPLPRATQRLTEKIIQISRTSWNSLVEEFQFEKPLKAFIRVEAHENDYDPDRTKIKGHPDIIHTKPDSKSSPATSIWEIKFVRSLTNEHVAQAAMYGWLWTEQGENWNFPAILLYNVRCDELWEIQSTKERSEKFVKGLLREKYTIKEDVLTDIFLKQCQDIVKEVEDAWEAEQKQVM